MSEFGSVSGLQLKKHLAQQANDQAHPPPKAQRPQRGTSEGNEAVGGRVQRLVRPVLVCFVHMPDVI